MLIECGECKQQISDSAFFCPRCGFVRKKIWLEKSERTYQALSIMLGLISGVMFFLSKSSLNPDTKDTVVSIMYFMAFMAIVSLIIAWVTSRYNLKSD